MTMFAEPGDVVVYNGQTQYAFNDLTLALMKRHLVPGNSYIVQSVVGDGVSDVRYSIFGDKDLRSGCQQYWYPSTSFCLFSREYMKLKYNLK